MSSRNDIFKVQTRLNGFFVPSEFVCICGISFLPTIEGLQTEPSYLNVLMSSFLEHNLYELVWLVLLKQPNRMYCNTRCAPKKYTPSRILCPAWPKFFERYDIGIRRSPELLQYNYGIPRHFKDYEQFSLDKFWSGSMLIMSA
jgi:hypothetical protein